MKESLIARLQGRRNRQAAQTEPDRPTGEPLDAAAVQVMAHTLISDLYGAGLRIQGVADRATDDLKQELADVAEQIDRVIRELRSFAFTHR